MWQILVADVSMSLDNVLAIAGAAREHPLIMAAGLVLSVALMGLAATFIATASRPLPLARLGRTRSSSSMSPRMMIWEGGWEVEEAVLAFGWPWPDFCDAEFRRLEQGSFGAPRC